MGHINEDEVAAALVKKKEKARQLRNERIARTEQKFKEQLQRKREGEATGNDG